MKKSFILLVASMFFGVASAQQKNLSQSCQCVKPLPYAGKKRFLRSMIARVRCFKDDCLTITAEIRNTGCVFRSDGTNAPVSPDSST